MILMFRKAIKRDALQLSVLFKQVYIDTYSTNGISLEFAKFITKQFDIKQVEIDIEANDKLLYLALNNENPVGVIQLEYTNKLAPIGELLAPEINKLYVLNKFFGNGIGQELMKKAEEELKIKGENQVWLWVLKSNHRAINFYTKQGYKVMGAAPFHMEVNTYENLVLSKTIMND